MQLRKADVRTVDGICYLHITPEAGTVKGKMYRDVPVHQQLVDVGFLEFVDQSPDGRAKKAAIDKLSFYQFEG
ncbi:MAG: hypothetical protein ABI414_12525 [Devosia sp.]